MTEMDVISFGSVFLEIVFGHLERLPLPGEEIYVDPFAFSCGGAVTIAVAARRAGASAGLATVARRRPWLESGDPALAVRRGRPVPVPPSDRPGRRDNRGAQLQPGQGVRKPHATQTIGTWPRKSNAGAKCCSRCGRHGATCTPAPAWWIPARRRGP